MNTFPRTSSFCVGEVVPMPTFPPVVIDILVKLPAPKSSEQETSEINDVTPELYPKFPTRDPLYLNSILPSFAAAVSKIAAAEIPLTCNFADGADVPIPSPLELILAISVVPTLNNVLYAS